jgi:hypothetical protein
MGEGEAGSVTSDTPTITVPTTQVEGGTRRELTAVYGQVNDVYSDLKLMRREQAEFVAAFKLVGHRYKGAETPLKLFTQWKAEGAAEFAKSVQGFAENHVKDFLAENLEYTDRYGRVIAKPENQPDPNEAQLLHAIAHELSVVGLVCPDTWLRAGYRIIDFHKDNSEDQRAEQIQLLVDQRNAAQGRAGDRSKTAEDHVDKSHPLAEIQSVSRWIVHDKKTGGYLDYDPLNPYIDNMEFHGLHERVPGTAYAIPIDPKRAARLYDPLGYKRFQKPEKPMVGHLQYKYWDINELEAPFVVATQRLPLPALPPDPYPRDLEAREQDGSTRTVTTQGGYATMAYQEIDAASVASDEQPQLASFPQGQPLRLNGSGSNGGTRAAPGGFGQTPSPFSGNFRGFPSSYPPSDGGGNGGGYRGYGGDGGRPPVDMSFA